jgi:hypothetical protein
MLSVAVSLFSRRDVREKSRCSNPSRAVDILQLGMRKAHVSRCIYEHGIHPLHPLSLDNARLRAEYYAPKDRAPAAAARAPAAAYDFCDFDPYYDVDQDAPCFNPDDDHFDDFNPGYYDDFDDFF